MSPQLLLWPIIIYLGAALVIPRLRPWIGEGGRTVGLLLGSVLAFVVALLVVGGMDEPLRWTLSRWGDTVGQGHGIQVQADALASGLILLAGLLGMGALVGSLDEPEDVSSHDYQGGLLVILASVMAFALADNLLTFLVAGLMLDAGLIYGVGLTGRPRWFLVLILHSLVAQSILLGATLLLWRDTGATTLAGADSSVLWLVVASAIARLAPLPFSLLPVAFERLPQRVLALIPLFTMGVGSLLLGRVMQAAEGALDLSALAPLAALGVGLAGWVAWRRTDSSVRLLMLGAGQAAWCLWAFAWGQPTLAVATAWSGILALGALAVQGGHMTFRHGTQLPALVAALMLVGVPGSALWRTATSLSGEAWRREVLGDALPLGDAAHWLVVIAAIGTMGAVAALLHWLGGTDDEAHQPSRWTGVGLLAALSVPFIGTLFGLRVPTLPGTTLPASPLAAQLALLIIGWAGGFWLWRVRRALYSLHPLLDDASGLFSFVWLWRIIGRVGWLLLSGLRGMMLVLEGENYGWLLLFLFVTLVFLVQQ